MPVHLLPFSCFDRSEASVSIGSIPAFSLSASGMASRASANFSAASCSRPSSDFAQLLILVAANVSGAPPPATTDGNSITSFTTMMASWTDLSASSTTLCEPALSKRVTDFGCLQSSTKTHLSSSIFLSSTKPAAPKSFSNKSSRFVMILPPVAFASFVKSLSFTLLTASMPALDK